MLKLENKITGIISVAILIEGIITYFNEFFVCEDFPWQMIMSIGFGILVAVAYKVDVFALQEKV